MPMVTTKIKEAVPIIMPRAVRVKRTLLLQNVSKEKLRISPKAIRGRSRSGMRAAAISIRCYVERERGASGGRGDHRINRKSRPGAACYGKVRRRNFPDWFQNQCWLRPHVGQRMELGVDPSIGADGLSQNRART